jgi:hypothetical protein
MLFETNSLNSKTETRRCKQDMNKATKVTIFHVTKCVSIASTNATRISFYHKPDPHKRGVGQTLFSDKLIPVGYTGKHKARHKSSFS